MANTMFRAFYMKITFAYVYIEDYTSTEKTVMTQLKRRATFIPGSNTSGTK